MKLTYKQFLEELRKTRYRWYLTKTGLIRAEKSLRSSYYCPVTAVARKLTGLELDLVFSASHAIGLKDWVTERIMKAADNSSCVRPGSKTRRDLLKACGLEEAKS